MSLDDLDLFSEPTTPPTPGGAARKCRHPRDSRRIVPVTPLDANSGMPVVAASYSQTECGRCGTILDPDRIARGRRANRRGRRIQRSNMIAAGMDNLAGNLPGLDGKRGMFKGESKSGGAFPERLWRWLQAIPVAAGQVGVLVVSDAPGPGHKRRSVVVVALADWQALHGNDGL